MVYGRKCKAFISHDDLAGTNGLFFHPDWFREYIFPWYPKVWRPLKKKGIKIIFLSDGDYTEVVDDIIEAGADGFMFEPYVNLDYMAKHYGDRKILIGNASTSILTFGKNKEVVEEVKRCISQAGNSPGYFFCAMPHS